jgi:predicted AAA+ superfamily ATPase
VENLNRGNIEVMPHERPRLAVKSLLKKLKYFRVVSLQGARQTGKSFLARKLLLDELPHSKSLSFDSKSLRDQAQNTPDSFLESYREFMPLIIDEAQKAPNIFDAIKLLVDVRSKPGQYVLLGSTEFSREIQVKESLVGRLGRIRIHPMNFHEVQGLNEKFKINRNLFLKYLECGGLPGIAFARNAEFQKNLIGDWLAIICERDIHEFKSWKLDSDLALEILRLSSVLELPTLSQMAKKIRQTGKKIQKHVRALELLFCLHKVSPHPGCRGKPYYLPIDPAIVSYFNGDLHRKIHVTLLNEILCNWSYSKLESPQVFYYRSAARNQIDLVVGKDSDAVTAYQIFLNEDVPLSQLNIFDSLRKKVKNLDIKLYYPGPKDLKLGAESVAEPWERMVKPY